MTTKRKKMSLTACALCFVLLVCLVGFPQPAHAEICRLVFFIATFEDGGCTFGGSCSGFGCVGVETGNLYIIEDSVDCGCLSAA